MTRTWIFLIFLKLLTRYQVTVCLQVHTKSAIHHFLQVIRINYADNHGPLIIIIMDVRRERLRRQ